MRYKIIHSDSFLIVDNSYLWRDHGWYDHGEVYTPNGSITLMRYHKLRQAIVTFISNGRLYEIKIDPCPTRLGLIRMALKLAERVAIPKKT